MSANISTCRRSCACTLGLLLLLWTPDSLPAVEYAFPVSGSIDTMVWEAEHWDGLLAVDIGVHPGFASGSPERIAFYESNVVAVLGGVASRLDNPRGGTAVLLHADDGRTYYFAHLNSSPIEVPQRVERGAVLGTMGNTGTWSQFLEPHLHLSVANGHQNGTGWTADVDPVLWLQEAFGRGPLPVPVTTLAGASGVAYPAAEPDGAPLFPGFELVSSYESMRGENPLLAGIRIAPPGSLRATGGPTETGRTLRAPVRAPLTGAVRVHRDTPLGLRLQITNARGGFSILISGPIEPIVTTGELVFEDQVIGFTGAPIHYTIFRGGSLAGPEWFSLP